MSGAGEKEEGDAEAEADAGEAEMEGDDDDEEEEEEDDETGEGEMEGEMDGEVEEEEEDDNADCDALLMVQHRAVSAESGESSTQMRKTEEEAEEEKGLVDEEEEEEDDDEDGYFDTAEDVQHMFSGSAEEFIGELDGDDKFLELATDYEEDEDCKVNEDYIAPYILQQPGEHVEEVLRSDESEREREREGGREDDRDGDNLEPIGSRTRARQSLADMSLDQLETFLQGSDEERDFEAVDDREEYDKFLRAVLEDLPEDEKPEQSGRKEEEEEEEEDVDFEIEIEELLESDDASESVQRRKRKRPETREKRRQRARFQSRGPLRHLLPHVGGVTDNVSKAVNTGWPSNVKRGPAVSGFTAHQIGQLHSLIHEHVQLLVQTYSLCVWDPARQQESLDAQKLLLELAEARETVLAGKKTAFPDFCFRPPYTNPSAIDGVKRKPLFCWPPGFPTASPAIQGSVLNIWEPVISLPVRSLLDVAPLKLVPEFLTDVSRIMQARFEEFRHLHVEAGASKFKRVPFFETGLDEQTDQSLGRNTLEGTRSLLSGNVDLLPAYLPTPQIKQTMAAALVESTEKLGLAPVPKEVALAVRRFLPYFNKALYPHKAPPLSSSSRLLFTDSEDELLAMGVMKHNHNWSAIREEYLPSKEDHQIKIRAKNRSASKALPNSIKAVHMMKTSPLTDWEKKAIQEGLNYYKQDWNQVWARCVPHRNPETLQRQWRIAVGTQKSYKTSESSKERRRLYEASRRQKIAAQKAGNVQDWNPGSTHVVASGATTASAEKQRRLLSKKKKPKTRADNHSKGSLPWLDPQAVKSICNDRTQAVKLAPHLSFVIMPPHVQVLPQSQVQPQQPVPQQIRTFFAVGSTSDPCTKIIKSRSRNTGRNRDKKDCKRHDPFPEDRSQDPLVEQHIVMEKEELSDSDDEADAGVEFEHEEMGDSDKEK